jgi:PAS domain S-box-containing protein
MLRSNNTVALLPVQRFDHLVRASVEATSEPIVWLDRNGQICFANEAASRHFELPIERLLEKRVSDLDPNYPESTWLSELAILREKRFVTLESQNVLAGGRTIPVEVKASHLEIDGEEFVLIFLRDLTEKRAAEARQEAEAARRQEEKISTFLRQILEAISDPIFVKDSKHRWIEGNAALWSLMGGLREDYLGKSDFDVFPQAEAEVFWQKDDEVIKTGRSIENEETLTAPNRAVRHLSTRKSPLNLASGEVGLVGWIRDITDRRLLEEDLRDLASRLEGESRQLSSANLALESALRTRDEFLANMSHELRTPLHVILGVAELLQLGSYGKLNDDQGRAIETLESSGRHLLALINDVLDLSKIEAGRFELQKEPVDLGQIAAESLKWIQEAAAPKNLHVRFERDAALQAVAADTRRLRQVLLNLLSNAVKFTDPGGEVGITIRASADRSEVGITVFDSGIGISPTDQQKLFKPFVQLDQGLARRYEGTGLGLALTARLVELHGGRIELDSEVGRGSAFTVILPVLVETPPGGEQDVNVEAETLNEVAAIEVLLVDDNPTNLVYLTDYLEYRGMAVRTAADGFEAIDRVEEHVPDLILMDVQMPRLDGVEATRRLRQNPDLADVKIVMLTALSLAEDRERCLKAGADDFLAKPVPLVDIERCISKWAGR